MILYSSQAGVRKSTNDLLITESVVERVTTKSFPGVHLDNSLTCKAHLGNFIEVLMRKSLRKQPSSSTPYS